ncbi:MAG: nucleotide exchange factor GrpE [Candidatus Zambryskibacteria bacterium RIFCSPLOWO2_12_FULL_45_14]|uniref:Protein GrpE n=2 Tax=Candidatus Zambryskiibacteriota TaxID=1817925 RepID=A0A1G2UKI4_9BACT|nr:MAG: nucleotide exchange factor GrpE [Candidatus Zambryskibacteria bacterium RIFCSPLOWO2_02_FULL_44_12b]OHB13823.1 MAG: nucleotide exchange factor GrpE [Candidatus Zambryskibacteria bacterium RIFCSPLOWO2_12_FULL_45_14]
MKKEENEDIVIEDDPDSTAPVEAQKKLREKLKEAEEKAKEYLDGWQRSQADFVNLRKRDEEAKVEFLKFANADLVYQLIPVLDSLELSLPHGNKELEAIYRQLLSILKTNGFEEDNPTNQLFDPRKHESVGTISVEDKEQDHKILEIIQKGYILSGKIIRPAKVKIGEYHG